ncbi:MAG: oligosaccharide flippase family protein [Candidatus Woesearchaeota archaeon]
MRQKIISLIDKVYFKIFRTPATPEVQKFALGLGWIFVGTILSKFLLLIIQVLGGRFLGESLYGEFNLIYSIGSVLIIPISLGIGYAMIRFLAEENREDQRKELISTFAIFTFISLIIWTVIYYVFKGQISSILGVRIDLFVLAIFFASLMILQSNTENILQGLHRMRELSIVMFLSHLTMFGLFFWLYLRLQPNILLMFLPYLLQYFIALVISVPYFLRYLSFRFNKHLFQRLMGFGFFSLIIHIVTVTQGMIDQLMLNHYINSSGVGLYAAYYTSTIALVGIISNIFLKVFFPTVSRYSDKKSILLRLNKIIRIGSVIIIIVIPLVSFILINLYDYLISYKLICLFTVAAVIDFILVGYVGLLNSTDLKGVRFASIGVGIAFMINVGLNVILIPAYEVTGAIIATDVSMLFLLGFVYIGLKSKIKE